MSNDNAIRRLYQNCGADWLIEKADNEHTEVLLKLIKGYVSREHNILDLCCGYGRLTVPLIQEGYEVFGVDISDILVNRARYSCTDNGKFDNPFVIGNIKALPFKNDCFDFSFCIWASFNLLNTIDDQLYAVREMYRTLKPIGKALIECPLHEHEEPVMNVQVDDLSFDYFPLTINQIIKIGERSPFDNFHVTTQLLAGRKRIIAIFTK